MPPDNTENFIMVTAFKELAQYLGRRLDAIKEGLKDISIEKDIKPLTREMVLLRGALANVDKIANRPIQGNFKQDNSDIIKAIKNLEKRLGNSELKSELTQLRKALSIKVEAPDLKPLLDKLDSLKPDNSEIIKNLIQLEKSISKINQNKTLKLDDMQFRALSSAGGNMVFAGGGGEIKAGKTTVANVALDTANTEVSYTFPANTLSWKIKLRSQNTKLLFAFTTGKFPTSGDGTAYMTAPQNFIESNSGVDWNLKTIYLQTDAASQTVEILSFQI